MTPEQRSVHLGLIFGLPDEVDAEELIANVVAADREALLDELLVGLAGMKICTPEKGFRNIGDALSHIRSGVSAETTRCVKVAREFYPEGKEWEDIAECCGDDSKICHIRKEIAAKIERGEE